MVLDVHRNSELSRDVMQTVASLKGGLDEVAVVYLVKFYGQKGAGLQSDSEQFIWLPLPQFLFCKLV